MTFLILGNPVDQEYKIPYKGTYRIGPEHVDNIDDEKRINKLWRCYLDKKMENGGLNDPDLAQALELISEYKALGQSFEIVELVEHKNRLTRGTFIGYDLSFKNYQSMLSWGLKFASSEPKGGSEFFSIFRLAEQYFQPKINSYGLFDEYETILFLFDVLLEVNRISPGSFEPYLAEFKVLAVGLLNT